MEGQLEEGQLCCTCVILEGVQLGVLYWRGELHLDNKIEALTFLVCLQLEWFLSQFLSGSTLE